MSTTLFIFGLLFFYVLSCIRILNEYERAVIFRLGRALSEPKGPGLIFVFWPIDKAELLPDRDTFIMEIGLLLTGNVLDTQPNQAEMDFSNDEVKEKSASYSHQEQLELPGSQTKMDLEVKSKQNINVTDSKGRLQIEKLFENFPRLKLVHELAEKHHFFHWELSIADILTSTSPIINVNRIVTVTAETVQPLSEEDIELYRQRALDSYRLEAQGGAATDYRIWSFDAQGVQETYPFAKSGAANEIDLFVEATIADSTDGKGTPTAQLLLDVEAVVCIPCR